MPNSEPRASVFHIDRIVKTSARLFARNILLWVVIAVVIDIISLKFADELRTAVTSYSIERFLFNPDLSRLTTFITELPPDLRPHGDPGEILARFVVKVTWLLALITLLQASVSHLVFFAVKNHRSQISLAEAASFLSKEGFLLDLLRVIGITICVYLLMVGWFVVFLGAIMVTSYVPAFDQEHVRVIGTVIVSLLTLGAMVYLAIRWALAVPVAVVENRSVFQSIARSYRLTKSCWLTVGVIEVILVASYVVLGVVMVVALGASAGSVSTGALPPAIVAANFVVEMAGAVLATIVLAVCYYYGSQTVPGAEE